MSFTTILGPTVIDAFPWNEVWYDDDLASGNDDGTTEANAWQSITAMLAGVMPGDLVNMVRAASPVAATADRTLIGGIQGKPIWYRGMGSTPGDLTKWQYSNTASWNLLVNTGLVIVSDLDITGAATDFNFVDSNTPQTFGLRCSFTNTGVGSAHYTDSGVWVKCSFTNTSTFTSNNAKASQGNGVYIGCTFHDDNREFSFNNNRLICVFPL